MINLEGIFSKDTIDFLEIKNMIQKIEPASYYGRDYFKNPEVFKRGDETSLNAHYDRLKILDAWISQIDFDKLKRAVREFKNIKNSIMKIEDDELPNVVDFFEIKRFCYFYKRLSRLLRDDPEGENVLKLYDFIEIDEIWEQLDPKGNGQFFFSIDSDYAFELGKELEKYRSLEKEIFLKISERLQKLYELPVSNRTEFVLQRSDMRNHGLKQSDNVLVQGETAFSISYKIVKSSKDVSYTSEIEKLENELASEDIRYRTNLKDALRNNLSDFKKMIKTVTDFDRDTAIIEFGKRFNGNYPIILKQEIAFRTKNGRNQNIELFCQNNGFEYDQLDIDINSGSAIITGANMGGKTSALKTIGQLYIQCALGLPVTADSLETCLFDKVNSVYRTAEEDGLSGFAMEVMRINKIFDEGVNINLVDEFGSATNPREGSALAAASVKILDNKNAISIFVTHFSKPLEYGSINFQTGFLKESMTGEINPKNIYRYIDHHLKKIDRSEVPKAAIQISKALGLPKSVVQSAEEIYTKI